MQAWLPNHFNHQTKHIRVKPTANQSPEKQFLRGPVFILLGLGLLAMYLNAMPTGIVGAACLLLPLVIGAAVACGFYAVGKIMNYFVPSVHNLAWMVLAVAISNISGMTPSYIVCACYSWFKFVVKAFVGVVLVSIGVVFTDLGELAQSFTPQYVGLCAIVVFGAVLGAGLVGRLVGFHFPLQSCWRG